MNARDIEVSVVNQPVGPIGDALMEIGREQCRAQRLYRCEVTILEVLAQATVVATQVHPDSDGLGRDCNAVVRDG
jgi:hypothetical protein